MIKIPKTYMGKPIEGSLERVLAATPVQAPINPVLTPTDIQIGSVNDAWQISGVEYRNGIYTVDLAKSLLDGGAARTQDEWVAFSLEAQAKNEFYTGSMPLQHALFTAIYRASQNATRPDIEEIREFLKEKLFEKWLMTTTRIQYQPTGSTEDKIIHEYKLPGETTETKEFVFPDEYVKNSVRPSNYKTLLGTDNIAEIQEVYHWITGKDAYLWRVNERSTGVKERVARFVADSGRVGLDCGGNPVYANASLGVRCARSAPSAKI